MMVLAMVGAVVLAAIVWLGLEAFSEKLNKEEK